MAEKVLNRGDIVFRQGDLGDSFFQIEEGAVRIQVEDDGGESIVLTDLSAGDFFGEMAVLDVYPRSATAVVYADGTKLLEFPKSEMDQYFSGDPDRAIALMQHLGNRIRVLTHECADVQSLLSEMKQGEARSEGLLGRMKRFLAFRFGNADRPSAEELLEEREHGGYAGTVKSFPAGTVIFREGDAAGCMYDIHFGSVGIFYAYGTPEQKKLTELGANQFFGEMGLVSDEPRSATAVTMMDNTTLEIIDMPALRALMDKNPPKVWMIVSNLSGQLRRLTRDFMKACEEVRGLQK